MSDIADDIAIVSYVTMSTDSQYAFCIAGWLNSQKTYWQNNCGPPEDYYKIMRPYVERMLEQEPPLLAVLTADQDVYLGFCCGIQGVLHYVYTKGDFRKHGIARALISQRCGTHGGVYLAKTYKGKFLEAIEKRGWRHEEMGYERKT